MPKLKTHKGIKKRVKVSKKGKVKRMKGGAGHLMSSKSAKRRRQLRKGVLVAVGMEKKYRLALTT